MSAFKQQLVFDTSGNDVSAPGSALAGLSVLVVDDEELMCDFLCMAVEKSGVRHIVSANRGADAIDLVQKKMQYLYENSGNFSFMDSSTYETIEIPVDNLGDAKLYLLENEEYKVLFLDGEAISVDLPASVILEVVETEPVARGDTVSNITKPATLSTGHIVKVPPFIKEGDKVKVDTRTGDYLERAN